jgi:PAS domain S-box-containing protein
LAIARDLSERKATFQKLLESEERYRLLVESSPDGIVIHNNGSIIFANNAAARLVKLDSPDSLTGKDIKAFIHGELRCMDEKHIQKIKAIDGSVIDVEVLCITLPFKGADACQMIIRDVSDRKKAEELKENIEEKKKLLENALKTDQIKTELFSNISHELRTPINVIFATLQLMEFFVNKQFQNNDTKTLNKYLHITKQNCYRLLRLVNNSIDVSKIDSGFYQISLQNHDIVSLVEDITLSVAEYIENKSIQLEFDTNIEELVIACDPDKIERIMLNLLSNAAKFTKKHGSINVTLKKESDKVYISVKDTGIGIPKEKLDVVFQRYVQANNSLIKEQQGSGIGLSLVKSLAEMHAGRVCVYSEPNKGSEFIVELPANVVDSETPPEHQAVAGEGRIERINIEFSDIYGC